VNVWIYVGWAGVGNCCRKTVARPANLAQASQSRLGEMNRDSPKPVCTKGRPGDPLNFWASEHLAQARGVSPKRDPALVSGCSFEPSLRRRGLAWASTSRLSEGLGEAVRCLSACLSLDDWYWFGYECYHEKYVYNEILCMLSMNHEL